MSKAITFFAHAPFLTIGCRNFYPDPDEVDGEMILSRVVQFSAHKYTTSDPFEIDGLRMYEDKTKSQHIIIEADKGVSLENLIHLHRIYEAEAQKKAETLRQERLAKEKEYAEWKDFARILKSRF